MAKKKKQQQEPTPLELAAAHLSGCDPVLKGVIDKVGPCTLEAGGEPFGVLARSIVSQLISTAAARTISARLEAAAAPHGGLTPAAVLALEEAGLRPLGLSGTKARAILDLAQRTQDGTLPLAGLADLPDQEVFAHLTAVRGIGTWTAEMFMIFCLGRPDVLPVGDFGLRAGVRDLYQTEELPRPARVREIAEPWRPHRSIATWYVWRSRGFVPQSGE